MQFSKTNIVTFLFLSFLLITSVGFCQRNRYWYFGINAGLRFDSNNAAVEITNSPLLAFLQSTSMSDEQGNYLYFSNGITVSNKYHQQMLNGTGLISSSITGGENCISIPLPNNDSLYYIFHRYHGGEPIKYNESDTGYYYSIINMKKDYGNGDVVSKNNMILHRKGYSMTLVQHANNVDFWLVLKPGYSNSIYSYLLTQSGLNTTPVITDCQALSNHISFQSNQYEEGGRWILASPNSQLLAINPIYSNNSLSYSTGLFQFNNQTGKVSNPLLIGSLDSTTIVSFSPDSRRLYLSNSLSSSGNYLTQVTISNYDSSAVANSTTIIGGGIGTSYNGYGQGGIALSGKLYISKSGNTLSVINNPNDSSSACNFQENGLTLTHGFFKFLPHFWNTINQTSTFLTIKPISCNFFKLSFNSNQTGLTYKEWQFGDGSPISNDSIATHSYIINTDSVLVKFKIVKVGKTDTAFATYKLALHKKPQCSILTVNSGCIKDSVSFTSNILLPNNAPLQSSFWSFGDGSTAWDSQSIKKVYADTGTYKIKFSISDTLNCKSDTAVQTIVVNKKMIAGFSISSTICINKLLAIADSSKTFNTNIYEWHYSLSNGQNWVNNVTGNTNYLINTAGSYTLKQVIKNNTGCVSDTFSKSFVVFDKPRSSFILPKSCIKDTSLFINTSNSPPNETLVKYHWQFNDINSTPQNPDTSIAMNGLHRFSQTNSYNIRLVCETNKGCADTAFQNFMVNGAVPIANFYFPAQSFCSKDSVFFLDKSTVDFGSLTNIKWYFNGMDSTIINNPVYNTVYKKYFTKFGLPSYKNITLKFVAKSGSNCINTKDTTIVVKAHPELFFANLQDVCMNSQPYFITNANVINGAVGNGWYGGSGIVDSVGLFNPKLVIGSVPTYLSYFFKTPLGCVDSVVNTILVLDTPIVRTEKNKIVLEGGSILLSTSATSSSNLSFNWLPNIALNNFTIRSPLASPNNNIIYKITATQQNGCASSDTVFVKVLKSLIIPNVFSPNGDGVNDTWQIPYLNTYLLSKILLFNRNGKCVYENTGYQYSFDGNVNGKPLPVGTYYYIIEPGNGRNKYTGTVTILR